MSYLYFQSVPNSVTSLLQLERSVLNRITGQLNYYKEQFVYDMIKKHTGIKLFTVSNFKKQKVVATHKDIIYNVPHREVYPKEEGKTILLRQIITVFRKGKQVGKSKMQLDVVVDINNIVEVKKKIINN